MHIANNTKDISNVEFACVSEAPDHDRPCFTLCVYHEKTDEEPEISLMISNETGEEHFTFDDCPDLLQLPMASVDVKLLMRIREDAESVTRWVDVLLSTILAAMATLVVRYNPDEELITFELTIGSFRTLARSTPHAAAAFFTIVPPSDD